MEQRGSWLHFSVQHPAMEHMARQYLLARVAASKARNAKAPIEVQMVCARQIGVAHNAICEALQITTQAKIAIWEVQRKRAFIIERLCGAMVISVPEELPVNTEGLKPLTQVVYETMLSTAS